MPYRVELFILATAVFQGTAAFLPFVVLTINALTILKIISLPTVTAPGMSSFLLTH